MPPIIERAKAKLNLFLHITGRRDDGYHLLDSGVVMLDLADELTLAVADDFELKIPGEAPCALPDNSVVRMAIAVAAALDVPCNEDGLPPLRVTLTKHIPTGAGLGGGSSDAAAMLRGMEVFYGQKLPHDQCRKLVAEIGADVSIFLQDRPLRMQGIGHDLQPFDVPAGLCALVVKPAEGLATASVYHAFRETMPEIAPQPALMLPTGLNILDFCGWLKEATRNDLQAVACGMLPEIGDVIAALSRQEGCLLARMTGSGSACFGLFAAEETMMRAAESIRHAHMDWFVKACRVG